MHGFVPMGADWQPQAPAIIWADQRSAASRRDLGRKDQNRAVGFISGTAPAAGFKDDSAWLQKHDPQSSFDSTATLLMPKTMRTPPTTSSAPTKVTPPPPAFNVAARTWADDVIDFGSAFRLETPCAPRCSTQCSAGPCADNPIAGGTWWSAERRSGRAEAAGRTTDLLRDHRRHRRSGFVPRLRPQLDCTPAALRKIAGIC